MSFGIVCRQKPECARFAAYRYTWPGKDESYICGAHSTYLLGIAKAMGVHVQLIPLTDKDHSGSEGMRSVEDQRR
jgi:hypothetical protein